MVWSRVAIWPAPQKKSLEGALPSFVRSAASIFAALHEAFTRGRCSMGGCCTVAGERKIFFG